MLLLRSHVASQILSPFCQDWVNRRSILNHNQLPHRIKAVCTKKFSDLSPPLRGAPSRSGKQKEGPFMGRLRANIARLGNPMQDCHLWKGPDCSSRAVLPKPPSLGRRWRHRRRRIGASVLFSYFRCSSGHHPALSHEGVPRIAASGQRIADSCPAVTHKHPRSWRLTKVPSPMITWSSTSISKSLAAAAKALVMSRSSSDGSG